MIHSCRHTTWKANPEKIMNAAKLITFIDAHGFQAVELPNGSLLVAEQFAGEGFPDTACEFYGPYWTVVEPKAQAVRNWLGY
jgi:hypothetical protein